MSSCKCIEAQSITPKVKQKRSVERKPYSKIISFPRPFAPRGRSAVRGICIALALEALTAFLLYVIWHLCAVHFFRS
jgi:hypothetical protein